MALDSDDIASGSAAAGVVRDGAPLGQSRSATSTDRPYFGLAHKAGALWRRLVEWLPKSWLPRAIGANLRRRILLANLLGLVSLLFSMLYLSLHHGWLLDAKVDVVKTVARISAEAIAYRAVNERAVFDPNKIPEKIMSRAQRDDAFAALELPIDPQQAAAVLKKVVGPADLKARIYSPKGVLIINSEVLFSDGKPTTDMVQRDEEAPRLRNFWTRLHYWVINKELKVYRELGTANGFLYPEVKTAAVEGQETPILLLNRYGQQIVSMAEPIKRGSKILGVLLLSTKPGDIDDVLWDERWLILQIAAIAFVVAIGSALVLERTVAGPMRRLSEAANHVTENISARQELPDLADREDEVGQTGRAFVAMTNALYRRIEASEKFAADVAHELKNPLAAARSTAESMAYAKTDAERQELGQEIQSELKRLNRLINDVASASRLDAELARQEMQRIDVRNILESVNKLFVEMLGDDTRRVRLVVEPGLQAAFTVRGNDGRLGQVFTNLIDNALSFSPENGTIAVIARCSGQKVEICVEDEGPGIPSDKLGQIFDRFYSDRPQTDAKRGKNSGLGLSISKEIVISHKGEIFAENRFVEQRGSGGGRPAGARFVVRLPLSTDLGAGLVRRS